MDTVSRQKRSETMSAIRNKDTKIEVAFRKDLWQKGVRYRKNSAKYFGKPDVLLKKHKIVIFLDSCFWHGCKKHGSIPVTRKKFWTEKIERNKERDKEVTKYYKKEGWNSIRVWEHNLNRNSMKEIEKVVKYLKV